MDFPILESDRLILRLAQPSDSKAMLDFFVENEKHFEPWDPEKPPGFYTESYWLRRIETSITEFKEDKSLRLCLFLKDSNQLIGCANFTSFERGPFQNCRLGYKIGKAYEGQGLMSEALKASIQYVFGTLGFHRIEANFIPENEKSGAILKHLGFEFHGRATRYLKINGEWRDHIMTSLITS